MRSVSGAAAAVAAQRDQHFHFAAQHRFDRFHRVVAQRAIGGEVKVALGLSSSAFGDFSSIPMVRLPRTLLWPRTGHRPAPGFAQLPEQQLQVGDFTYRRNRVFMLSHAHRPVQITRSAP